MANWVTGELQAQLGDRELPTELEPRALGCAGGPGRRGGGRPLPPPRRCWACCWTTAATRPQIVDERGLGKAGGDELGAIVDQALADNPDVVEKIKGGNPKAIGALSEP